MQQPGQPGQPGIPMYTPYAGMGVVRPQPGIGMSMVQQQAQQAMMQQQQRQQQMLSATQQQQQQQHNLAQVQAQAAQAAQAHAQAHTLQQQAQQQQSLQQQQLAAQQQAAAAAQAQAQQQAAQQAAASQQQQRPMAGHHISASPHLQQAFSVNGPTAALHPQHHASYAQQAGVAMPTQGPPGAQIRPPRGGPVRPGQPQAVAVQQTATFQHSAMQQPGQQPGQAPHPQHAAGQMTPQPQHATPGGMGQPAHPQQTSAEQHQLAAHNAYNMSRAGSVQSQMGQPSQDASSLLKLYVHDFLSRHELTNTASAMRNEGGISEQPVPIALPKGALFEVWTAFWELATAGKGMAAMNKPLVFAGALKRIRDMASQINGAGGPSPQPGQQFQAAAGSGAALTRAPSQQQAHAAFMAQQQQTQQAAQQAQQHQQHAHQQQAQQQQQQAAAQQMGQAQPQAGMSPAQVAMQAQHLQQQQAVGQQHMLQQQQQQQVVHAQQQAARFQAAGPAGSPAQHTRPPPGQQHVYATPQSAHMGMQPPSQGPPNHPSPMQPSPRMVSQQGGVMPSPLQKPARPPNGGGVPGGTPTMMHAALSQQGLPMSQPGSGTFMHPATPQAVAASPVGSMTPQQQQHAPPHPATIQMAQMRQAQMEQQQKQAQAASQHMQHQQHHHPGSHLQQQQMMQQRLQHPQGQPGMGNTPQQIMLQQQFQQQQQHQQQQINALAQQAGIQNVIPGVMSGVLHSSGLAGRDFKSNLQPHELVRMM
ncbi:hypothetical protein CspeluHIS016_0207810 [Cutaneotrichosporon spelunceum]|uniref:LisH domain-containing protein n=1 Tax=Cutaneotrichosporon spelunceum TaxID=1672016 RepID=A0AAD3TRX8_9TREE|nr:hypothetical protein CspeluHIS016_0207810 [Cutaneotrichosporon spelunceum]